MESIGILGPSVREHDAATRSLFTLARERRVPAFQTLAGCLGLRDVGHFALGDELADEREALARAGLRRRRVS